MSDTNEIKLHDLSDRELLILAVESVNRLTRQVQQQNGRVTQLELWRANAKGALMVLTILVPIVSVALSVVLNRVL